MPRKKKLGGKIKVGRALANSRRQERKDRKALRYQHKDHPSVTKGYPEISVTELNSLEDFLEQAQLSERQFVAERRSNVVILGDVGAQSSDLNSMPIPEFKVDSLPVPRRPEWIRGVTTAEQLDRNEKKSFLAWRRGIAKLEEERPGIHATPFEKNIEYWRQLWRVVERSDILVQVVDARNPLLFRSNDLEDYVLETDRDKRNMLLLNKADLLTPAERASWAEYFNENGIAFRFFSAKMAQARLDEHGVEKAEALDAAAPPSDDPIRILRRSELRDMLVSYSTSTSQTRRARGDAEARASGKAIPKVRPATVGMVGYPNVGKSSVINALLGVTANDHSAQRVSVAATPGHTKHFQTLQLTATHQLCDCPGLVFPSFVSTKAEMIVNGVLPVDQAREADNIAACEHICARVPKNAFEMTYGLKLGGPGKRVAARRFLEAYCTSKGLMASTHGGADTSRGARLIIKDFINGKVTYVTPPPASQDVSGENAATDQGDGDVDAAEEALILEQEMMQLELLEPELADVSPPKPGSNATDGNDATKSSVSLE